MPSDLNKQVHNIQALFLGTARLLFANAALTPAIAAVQGYRDLGNIVSLSMQSDKKEVQHMGSYSGKKRLDKTEVVESNLKFTFKLDELTAANMAIFFQGDVTTPLTQSLLSSATVDALDFSSVNASLGMWYDITNSGARVRNITAITIGSLTENTDYVVDYSRGMVYFLTAQSSSLAVTVTATAITGTSTNGFQAITLLTDSIRRGICRIMLENQEQPNSLGIEIPGFYGELRVNGNTNIDGANFADLEFVIDVIDVNATALIRRDMVTPTGAGNN